MAPRAARSGILTIVIGTRKRFFRNVRDAAHALATTGCIRAHACIARRLRLTSNDGGDLRNSPHTAPIRLRSPPPLVSMIADIGTTGGFARPLRGRQQPNASPNVRRTYRDVLGKYPWPLPFPRLLQRRQIQRWRRGRTVGYTARPRRSGGIGRRSGLKIRRP